MKWGLVLDSSCDLKERDFQNLGVDFTIVPLKILVDDQEFIDNDDIDMDELTKAMANSKKGSQTACPSPGDFYEGYMKSENVLCFTLTGGLSGTYNSARMAKELVAAEDSSKNVYVCDTKSTGGNLILLMDRSLELIKEGKTFDEIQEHLEKYNKELDILFTLGSYHNLIQTGRMSSFAGTVAKHLNIRLICTNTEEGEIKVSKKCRGQKTTYNKMIEMMKENKDLNQTSIYIHHCKNEKDAIYIREKILQEFPQSKIVLKECKGLTTFYTMEGGILISY